MRNSHTIGPKQGFGWETRSVLIATSQRTDVHVSLKAYAHYDFRNFYQLCFSLEAENILFFPTSMKPFLWVSVRVVLVITSK